MSITEVQPVRVQSRQRLALGVLQLATAAGLVIDAVVHLRDAEGYDLVQGTLIGEGNLFRGQAVVALVLAAAILLRPRPVVWAIAALVAASAAGAVLLYTYVDLGAVAGLPDMYEPTWLPPGKLVSAVAEASTAILAVAGFFVSWRMGRNRQRTSDR